MHKIFADECIHTDLIDGLKTNGHNVQTVHDVGLSGVSDIEIFNHSISNSLTLLTFDRGFGDIFTYNISESSGVVIELIGSMNKTEIIDTAIAFFSADYDIKGKLVIIGLNKIRIIER